MLLSTTKNYNNYNATIIVDWRNENDYDVYSVELENENNFFDVTEMFESQYMITEIFGDIDWELVYRQTQELI
jgi:hypothetical protein